MPGMGLGTRASEESQTSFLSSGAKHLEVLIGYQASALAVDGA